LCGCCGDGDSCFSDSSAERSPAPPNHTMLSGFDGALAATLQRISAPMRSGRRFPKNVRPAYRTSAKAALSPFNSVPPWWRYRPW
jgi:hypothetical protein